MKGKLKIKGNAFFFGFGKYLYMCYYFKRQCNDCSEIRDLIQREFEALNWNLNNNSFLQFNFDYIKFII